MTVARTLYAGLDAGVKGGIVILSEGGLYSLNLARSTETDIAGFLRVYADQIAMATIERVWGRLGDTPKTAGTLCQSYGFLRGVLAALNIPREEVTPQKWQSKLGVQAGGDKRVARQFIEQRYPGVKWVNNISDAGCIAHYSRLVHSRNGISDSGGIRASEVSAEDGHGATPSAATAALQEWNRENE